MNATTKIEASLASAMAAAFGEIEAATKGKDGQVGQQKYKYADIGAVIDAIKPALIAHGLFFTQRPQPSENGITVETVLHHTGGEEMSLGALFVPADKNNAQAFGSALTYARRYALVTAFGVPVEDDDGNAASKPAGGQSRESAVSPRQDEPVIAEEQYTKLMALITAARLTPAQFNQTMGCPRVCDLPASKYAEAVERLETRMEELAKKETNAKAKETA